MTSYLYRMPSGIPGAVSREENKTIESVPFDSTTPFSSYGLFGKIVNGKLQPVGAGDAATAVYGVLVRRVLPRFHGHLREGRSRP